MTQGPKKYKNLTRFKASDSPAAHRSLAHVMIIELTLVSKYYIIYLNFFICNSFASHVFFSITKPRSNLEDDKGVNSYIKLGGQVVILRCPVPPSTLPKSG